MIKRWISWCIPLKCPKSFRNSIRRISERALRNHPEIKLVQFYFTKTIKKYVRPVFHLVNETFRDIYGFSAMEETEMDEFANDT